MDEFLPMVYVLSHKDFGPIPTHGLGRPHIRFWASWVEKIKNFVFKNTKGIRRPPPVDPGYVFFPRLQK